LGLFRIIHTSSFLLTQKILLHVTAVIVISFWLLRMITLASLPRRFRMSIKNHLKGFGRYILFGPGMEKRHKV
jgi:hypothetical protein